MYAQPSYGYGPNISAPFNPNGVPQQPHNPHQQQQNLQQPGQQHMMYNPSQQYAGAAMGGAAAAPSPYGNSSPAMGGNAGAMGMMQNNGMAHTAMAGPGHVPAYQTPYSSSPYGGNIPSTAASLPPNFSNPPSFNMNAQNMNLQHPNQRMQPPPNSSTPTQPGQRVSPFAGGQQHTPPNAGGAQSQFATPQIQNQTQNQQGQPILTPQTPTFPQSGGNLVTPLSPGSEVREKERVTLLLEINKELLLEVIRLQNVQQEEKKSEAAAAEKNDAEKAKEVAKPGSRDYLECMRRLQSNLAYLAAIADRSHKPSSQIPPHPAIMFAPPLSPKPSTAASPTQKPETKPDSSTPTEDKKPESSETEENKSSETTTDRSEILKDHYKKLQGLFPGVDPKKEPTSRPQGQMGGATPGQKTAADINAQQKLQNDLLRQKMMQAQQAQAQAMAQQQAQNQTR